VARRKIVCVCGHPMTAPDDERLFAIVMRHVDDEHENLGYNADDVRRLIAEEATDD
jgi:hypothetical protein